MNMPGWILDHLKKFKQIFKKFCILAMLLILQFLGRHPVYGETFGSPYDFDKRNDIVEEKADSA